MGLFTSVAICLLLTHCKTHTFLTLTSDCLLVIVALVDGTGLSIVDVSPSAVFYIFLMCADGSLTSSLFSMLYLCWVCKFLGFGGQTYASFSTISLY